MNDSIHRYILFLGAWIITGGMNTGIMKLVGEIVQLHTDRSRPIHLIVSKHENIPAITHACVQQKFF
jgi:hypothetical protein